MTWIVDRLLRRPARSSILRSRGRLVIRSQVREAPGLVVLAAAMCLAAWGSVVAVRAGSWGSVPARGLALLLAYPLIQRLGGGSGAVVDPSGVSQRIGFSRRGLTWNEFVSASNDLEGHVTVVRASGDPAVLLVSGLPPAAWTALLSEWANDPQLLTGVSLDGQVRRLRADAEAVWASVRR